MNPNEENAQPVNSDPNAQVNPNEAAPADQMQDPNAINPDGTPASDVNTDYAFANNDFKRIKLLNIYDKLKSYIKILRSSLDNIEQDKLTSMQLVQVSAMQKELSALFENINFYICNVYSLKEYNDNLYSYLLYNKQLADITSKLRHALHIVSDVKDEDEK